MGVSSTGNITIQNTGLGENIFYLNPTQYGHTWTTNNTSSNWVTLDPTIDLVDDELIEYEKYRSVPVEVDPFEEAVKRAAKTMRG